MKKSLVVIFSLVIVGFFSCKQTNQKANADGNVVHEVVDTSSANQIAACFHSTKIFWKGSKPGGEHNGVIKLKEGGNFVVTDNKLNGGTFLIDMTSIIDLDLEDQEWNAKLVGHLKSADFFNVDSFPESKFVITNVDELSGDEGFNTLISGDLTIKEITLPIQFKAKVEINEGKVTAVSDEIILDRTKWGVTYQSKSIFKELKDKFINDEFVIKIEIYSM